MSVKLRHLYEGYYKDRIDELIAAAREARWQARARYSGFMVGAAVLTEDGKIHVGVNVEAVDYDVTHAEESALSAMALATNARPVMIVAVGADGNHPTKEPVPVVQPCGKCRQKIYEWIRERTGADIDVVVSLRRGSEPMLCSIRELLPLSFG